MSRLPFFAASRGSDSSLQCFTLAPLLSNRSAIWASPLSNSYVQRRTNNTTFVDIGTVPTEKLCDWTIRIADCPCAVDDYHWSQNLAQPPAFRSPSTMVGLSLFDGCLKKSHLLNSFSKFSIFLYHPQCIKVDIRLFGARGIISEQPSSRMRSKIANTAFSSILPSRIQATLVAIGVSMETDYSSDATGTHRIT